MCLLCVSGHSEHFLRNLLRGWDPGRPPPLVGINSQLSPFFFDGSPNNRPTHILHTTIWNTFVKNDRESFERKKFQITSFWEFSKISRGGVPLF